MKFLDTSIQMCLAYLSATWCDEERLFWYFRKAFYWDESAFMCLVSRIIATKRRIASKSRWRKALPGITIVAIDDRHPTGALELIIRGRLLRFSPWQARWEESRLQQYTVDFNPN